jgi:prepilin-type N-terminal cleavage/methylation domain-containing protein
MTRHAAAARGRRRSRGSSLIEVLVALAIMGILMVGILQMFSVALVVNAGAGARTQLLFKCQQVVENIRYYASVIRANGTPPANTGIPDFIRTAACPCDRVDLPYDASDLALWAYWGPAGANVMEVEKGPYQISYSIQRSSGLANPVWIVAVTAEPTADPTAVERFFRVGPGTKRVDYVASFP